jgi:hypothetical protein
VWRSFTLDDRLDVAVAGIQTAEQVEDLTRLGDGMPDVAQIVGEALELGAVVSDAHVALLNAAELRLVVDGALQFVVAEEGLDITPESECRGVRLVDDVEHRLLDGGVEPIDDAMVNLTPLGRALCQRRRIAHMVGDAEFPKNRIKETTPLAIVGIFEFKENRDMGAYVYSLDGGCRNRLREVEIILGIGGCGGSHGGGRRRCGSCGERINKRGSVGH